MKLTLLIFASFLGWSSVALAQTFASSIHQCPRLEPRERAPTGVNDLRPDDIGVIAGIGDSIMAGFVARGVDPNRRYVTMSQFKEARGVSFAMGGDRDAVTLPNILEHYTRGNLQGASIGSRSARICEDELGKLCGGTEHDDDDYFNAAQSGATSKNFTEQAEYLIERIGRDTSLDDAWKILTIFLGANDIVHACQAGYGASEFEERMRHGLRLLKRNINNVYINLIVPPPANAGVLIKHSLDRTYAKPTVPPNPGYDRGNCPCCYESPGVSLLGMPISPLGQVSMTLDSTSLENSIRKLAKEFADPRPDATFTVAYQNLNNLPTRPKFFSNIDGYHPSKLAHTYMAKLLWNNMFRKEISRPPISAAHEGERVRCPTESDRFRA
ncbi:hypothetical protein BCR43DRAFT_499287 [Syncephalastrum racemosum]|uniref:SGNH hydrolase-type esterase domain-containing protein n=1 Tax=Syncephalastrum racemosum TaxID=13706 RepID=A0A1X2H019_SYNRA|nr:hypothetical protein BCR43DRAFT_499287 [Syncephalastrum racemosum]